MLQYLCVQPYTVYYSWQVDVMLNNFTEMGINQSDIHILLSYDSEVDTKTYYVWNKIIEKYNDVNFYFYPDTRFDKSYIPSVYFNALKQHIKEYSEFQKLPLYLFDCDSIFTKPFDFNHLLEDDIWYLSDTVQYISYNYVISKGEEQYKKMCEIVGINPMIPMEYNADSGGAQHIVKNTTYEYWDKVESDSIKLYNFLSKEEKNWKKDEYPIQKWTSGMWSLLWNAWLFGHKTKVVKELDFCWATDGICNWEKTNIYHNAGVTSENRDMFNKSYYQNILPYNLDITKFNQIYCSYNYLKLVKKKYE
jgi:hypothetical protein